MDIQLFQQNPLKRLSLFHCVAFNPCQIAVDCIYEGPFWALSSVSLAYLSILSSIPRFLDYSSFTVDVKLWKVSVFQFCSSPSILCCLSGSSASGQERQHEFVSTHKTPCWELSGTALYLKIKLGRTDALTILSLPVHRYGVSLHLFSSLMSFIRVLYFSFIDLMHIVRFIPKYFGFGSPDLNVGMF